jgi:transcriptional regulator with XRE-family HTH domain
LLLANDPQMNFTQIHERLRLEMLRRIQRGTLSVSLLARQTGLGQPHLSNFLRGRRKLSLEAMDRILAAQHLSAADLLPVLARADPSPSGEADGMVPVVTHAAALFEPYIRPSAVQSMLYFPAGALEAIRTRTTSQRRAWQRFVAVRIYAADAPAMEPLVQPEAIALIDRHYNSLAPYRPNRPNLYAVRHDSHLKLRYVDLDLNRLVLRPLNIAYPVELLDADQWESPSDPLAGRVAFIVNDL